ncbi:hypothetical protein H5410_038051 [Solanum commersonii]|uniref:Uncharacterized protein n=1 Tax=Solanum commersonii TaxID=4109 RepID=A0A9J5Y7Y0_SOLCO|nr:hypothetical protein H5410_038051 [Solanum commersonii]
MILAGDGGSDGFGVGYLVGLASSKLVRFMSCAPRFLSNLSSNLIPNQNVRSPLSVDRIH